MHGKLSRNSCGMSSFVVCFARRQYRLPSVAAVFDVIMVVVTVVVVLLLLPVLANTVAAVVVVDVVVAVV
eukprot:2921961-Pyramimonas_sp.AAC.1